MRLSLNKKVAVAAGLAFALGTAGTALATTITIAPTIGPTIAPTVGLPQVTNSFNIVDSFLLNSHNSGDSEFIDFSNGLNVLYNTVQLGDPHDDGMLGLGAILNVVNVVGL